MPLKDYNKYKEISPTSQNDSGSTIGKARPILISSNIDGFEDRTKKTYTEMVKGCAWETKQHSNKSDIPDEVLY